MAVEKRIEDELNYTCLTTDLVTIAAGDYPPTEGRTYPDGAFMRVYDDTTQELVSIFEYRVSAGVGKWFKL